MTRARAGVLFCTLGLLWAAHAALYARYLARLSARRPPLSFAQAARLGGVPVSVLNSVGSVAPPIPGRFTQYPARKPAGRTRVGAFGDSLTYGYDTAPGLDFPAQLSALFRESGRADVDVLNFGNPWHGLHQIHRFWDAFGRSYELDAMLIGPAAVRAERDATFNHGEDAEPFYLHGRYVLAPQGPRFIDVEGGPGFRARFLRYFRYVPTWNYLRYDLRPPAFLQCLLPSRRTMRNPFYYCALPVHEELRRIDTKLLREMTASGVPAIVLELGSDRLRLNSAGLPLAALALPRRFPYWSRKHPTAMGNALIARACFDILTGRPAIEWPVLSFLPPAPSRARRAPAALDSYSSAELKIAGRSLGALADDAPFGATASAVDFRARGIRGLIALSLPGGDPMDALFLPTRSIPREGSRLELVFDGGARREDLGPVRLLDGRIAVAYARLDRVREDLSRRPNRERARRLIVDENWIAPLTRGAPARLTLDSAPIAAVARADYGDWEVLPDAGPLIQAVPKPDSFVDARRLAAEGRVDLALSGRASKRFSFAHWRKITVRLPYPRGLPKLAARHHPPPAAKRRAVTTHQ